MKVKRVKLIYFSPTGTTQKVLESIAKGITVEDVEHINLTLTEGARQTIPPFSDELVIIGAPVYGGRLPVEAINRFKQLKASKTLAILIVVYGNREPEDALLEFEKILPLSWALIPWPVVPSLGSTLLPPRMCPSPMDVPITWMFKRQWILEQKLKIKSQRYHHLRPGWIWKFPADFHMKAERDLWLFHR